MDIQTFLQILKKKDVFFRYMKLTSCGRKMILPGRGTPVAPASAQTFQDVHSYADFWSWLRLGYLPVVLQPVPRLMCRWGSVAVGEGRYMVDVSGIQQG